ncbi:MAG: hypothetical protein CL758_00965 [Chloroflexi bacterium]|nr:hypothetical protein [Chloroflexota bacterium]|tara:strand:+ start:276 stop:1097 length:822 start_codon:yes stop_codon:yes gene_type:complete
MNNIGIMQGRLSPAKGDLIQWYPVDTWESEFYLAKELGLVCIEWVFQKNTANENLISTDSGIKKILDTSYKSNVQILSITADYYMEENLISQSGEINNNNLIHLEWLLSQAKKLDARYVMTPFVDGSSLKTSNQHESLIMLLKKLIPLLEKSRIELHMETDLHPKLWSSILSQVNHPLIRACYDIGDRASLGYDLDLEFMLLSEFIGSVHVKDRPLNSTTVPLGQGNANFHKIFKLIKKTNFNNPFIIQSARNNQISIREWGIENKQFIEKLI